MTGIALVFLLIGLCAMLNASPYLGDRIGLARYHFSEQHLSSLVFAALVFVAAAWKADKLLKAAPAIFTLALALNILPLTHGFEIRGRTAWFPLPIIGWSIGPYAYLVPAFHLLCGCCRMRSACLSAGNRRLAFLALPWAGFGAATVLLALQGNWETVLLLAVPMAVAHAVTDGVRRTATILWILIVGLVAAFLCQHPDWSGPERDYGFTRVLEAVAGGGWLGRGPGSDTAGPWLTDAHADFALALIAEQYGKLAVGLMLLLAAIVPIRALAGALSDARSGCALAMISLGTAFFLAACGNAFGVLGVLPAIPFQWPLVAYGRDWNIAFSLVLGCLSGLLARSRGPAPSAGAEWHAAVLRRTEPGPAALRDAMTVATFLAAVTMTVLAAKNIMKDLSREKATMERIVAEDREAIRLLEAELAYRRSRDGPLRLAVENSPRLKPAAPEQVAGPAAIERLALRPGPARPAGISSVDLTVGGKGIVRTGFRPEFDPAKASAGDFYVQVTDGQAFLRTWSGTEEPADTLPGGEHLLLPLILGDAGPGDVASLLDLLAPMPGLLADLRAARRVDGRRWDLLLHDRFDGLTVRLPAAGEAAALSRLDDLHRSTRLLDRAIEVIDLRIPNRMLLKG